MQPGIAYALTAFIIWGLYPLYWKQLTSISDMQLAMHRIAWSFVLLAIILTIKWEWVNFFKSITKWKVLGVYVLSSAFIFINWYILVWAINAGFIVETSLGLFINPLFNVLLGVVIFKEKLHKWQWFAIGLALAGVIVCAVGYGKFPWVALTTAITFSLYGLIKKQAPLNPLHGMTLETAILFPAAVIYLIVVDCQQTGAFLHVSVTLNLLLIGGGVVTVVPLLLFSAAAQLIPLSLLGILQYIAPSLQFLLGVLVYNEPLSMTKLAGFILVWLALAIYTFEGHVCRRNKELVVVVATPTGSDDSSVAFEEV